MSLPFNPALMKACPSHLMRAYERAKARPLKARDAIRGAPSPWKVWKMTAMQAKERDNRLQVSLLERLEDIARAVKNSHIVEVRLSFS